MAEIKESPERVRNRRVHNGALSPAETVCDTISKRPRRVPTIGVNCIVIEPSVIMLPASTDFGSKRVRSNSSTKIIGESVVVTVPVITIGTMLLTSAVADDAPKIVCDVLCMVSNNAAQLKASPMRAHRKKSVNNIEPKRIIVPW